MEPTLQELWDEETKSRGEQPVEKPAALEAPAASVAPQATTPVAAQPEAAKPTTEELLAQALARLDKVEGRTRNVEGHIGGLTSQQNALKETVTAAKAAAEQVRDAPTQAQIKAAATNPEEWDRLKEDFPEWSVATEKFVEAKLSGVNAGLDAKAVNALVASAVQETAGRITATMKEEIVDSAMSAVFPTWKEDIASPAFVDWAKTQPADVQALAASSKVGDAARMMGLYAEARKANPVNQLIDKRKQMLENSVAAPKGGKPALVKSPDQMTAQELWDYEARQAERRRVNS